MNQKNKSVPFFGAGGQVTLIIPSRDLVMVRLGKYTESVEGMTTLDESLAMLLDAVPEVGGWSRVPE